MPFLCTGKVLASALEKTWKWNIDQLWVTWPILPPILHPKLDTFFWNSSARIWMMLRMDTRVDGPVLAVFAAYQNNLVTSKMMTSKVVQCLLLDFRSESVKSFLIPKFVFISSLLPTPNKFITDLNQLNQLNQFESVM